MTTNTQPTTPRAQATRRRVRRATAVVGAGAVNAVLWWIASVAGADFVHTDSTGTAVVTLDVAVVFTEVFALLGWAALALLERYARRARPIWTTLAIGVTLLSLVPVFLVQATASTHAALTVLHLAVAAVIVPAFRRTAS